MTTDMQSNKSSKSKFLWIGLIVAAVIVTAIWGWTSGVLSAGNEATSASTEANAADAPASDLEPLPVVGHPAPDFTLKNLDGEQVSLSDFRGQPVVLNFWATWCGPCRVEMPHFQEAYTTHQDEGVVIVGVNLTERDNPSDIPGFLDEFGLTFPIILDEKGEVANTYNVFGQPASVFVDKDGIVHEVFYGPVNKQFIDERISEILGS